jgi:tripartite-type tricarboxylate transporter receptor subunit TctC
MPRNSRYGLGVALAAAGLAGLLGSAAPTEAAYPEQTVTIIVPYSPGGSTDTQVRLIAEVLEEQLGQNIIIKNTTGAGGAIGMAEAASAEPDGYTLGIYNTNAEVLQATGSAEFQSADLVPVALFGEGYLTVAAKGDSQFESLQDVKEAAATNPGEISVAMGRGTLAQFVAVLLEERLGEDLALVNVGSGAQKKAAVLGGHEDTLIEPAASLVDLHDAGELRILALFAPERSDDLPDVPTAKEQGVDLVAAQALGLFAPEGTPEEAVRVLADAVKAVEDDPEVFGRLQELGLEWNYKAGEDYRRYMQDLRELVFSVKESAGY